MNKPELKVNDKVSVIKECVIPNYTVTPEAEGKITLIRKAKNDYKAIVEFNICGLKVEGIIDCKNLKRIEIFD